MKARNTYRNSPFHLLKSRPKLRSMISIIMAILTLHLTVGCSYYRVKTVDTTPETIASAIDRYNRINKYAIVHSGISTYHLDDLTINVDDQTITGIVRLISPEHQYRKEVKKSGNRYKRASQDPMNELHIYLDESYSADIGSPVTIPVARISSLSVNDSDSGRSILYFTVTLIGALAVLTVIAVAAKSSCPFVYIKDGESYRFVGELYPGSITRNIQRDDYLLLPDFKAQNDMYELLITNELKEIQHTDFLELIVVEHTMETEVLIDSEGKIHTLADLVPPTQITADDKSQDLTPALEEDNDAFRFDSEMNGETFTRNLVATFENDKKSQQGKLYLRAKNSLWIDYVYGKFNEQFGSYFNKYQEDLQDEPAEKSLKWTSEQHIPLSVFIETSEGWELVEEIRPVGPLANRNMVIPIDLRSVNSEEIRIKLETGFMFWEVDQIGFDLSENQPTSVTKLAPTTAIDDMGKEVVKQLLISDQVYFTQEQGGRLQVQFPATSENPEMDRTVYVKNRGYYNYVRDYKGIPDVDYLKSFEQKEAFTKFAYTQFLELRESEQEILASSIK